MQQEQNVGIDDLKSKNTNHHYKITGSCIGCKNCLRVCPVEAINIGPMKINDDKCIGCGRCYLACPGRKIIEV